MTLRVDQSIPTRSASEGCCKTSLALRASILTFVLSLTGCLTAQPEDRSKIYNEDGVQLFSQGQYQAALEQFDAALTLRPRDPALLYNLGGCYDRLGQRAKAEQYYVACLQYAPDHADCRLALASVQFQLGKQAEGSRLIEAWLGQNQQKADPYVLDAWRLRQEKNYPQAQGRLHQALAIDPHNRRALAEYGIWHEEMGMPDRALVLYERILARDPQQADVAQRLKQLQARGVKRPRPD